MSASHSIDLAARNGDTRWAFVLPAFMVIYFLVGVIRIGQPEIYPFASWAMFSTVPNDVVKYRLRLLRIGERDFEPPLDYVDAEAVLSKPTRISAVTTINGFGAALRKGDEARAKKLRALIEETLLPADAEYEIVEQRYWPLEKWRNGTFEENRVEVFHGHDTSR